MKTLFIFIFSFVILQSYSQTKTDYLEDNRFDLTSSEFDFPQKNFNIIGFGAYHGSAKTENTEIKLIKSLINDNLIKYYLPETDYSIAYFFNKFLKNGDTSLLRDLVIHYGVRVPQERTIEVYNKWKQLKDINDKLPQDEKIEIIGIDYQVNYRYTSRHILDLVDNFDNKLFHVKQIENMVKTDTTSYATGSLNYAGKILKNFADDYEINKNDYKGRINDSISLNHIIRNLKISFNRKKAREEIIFENYLALDSIYNFKNNPQFLRMGFFHIQKSRQGKDGRPSFFTMLKEKNIYSKDKIVSIIGYLTDSEVLWDELFDENRKYTGFTTEGGYGIGDYEKEYFRGIQNLKDSKISDKTLFRLNKINSPYTTKSPDLIEVIMTDEKSNKDKVKDMSTLDFLDYAVLISGSKASTPIFEME